MRKNLGGVCLNLENSDFGSPVGNILSDTYTAVTNIFTGKKDISKDEQFRLGLNWINALYNELKPNASYQTFIESLKLDSYNEKIPEEDYRDFVSTIGFNVHTSQTIADKVKAAIISSLRNNKNGLPTRRSIMSAFMNPSVIKITYWDATKIVASSAATNIKSGVETIAAGVSTGASIVGFIIKYRVPILIGIAGIGVYTIYSRRQVVKERIVEKILSGVGLGVKANPSHKPNKEKKKAIQEYIRTYIKEGYPQRQAVAMAYSKVNAKSKRKKA